MHRWILLAEKVMITYCITKSYQFKFFDSLVLKLQDTGTGILNPNNIHVHLYMKFWLVYVGETKGELRKRLNGHRLQINNGGKQLLYRHFNLPDHSVLSMKVQILEKIYHPTNKPINSSTPFRRKREEHWIRQLGTAAPYGCNDISIA